MTIEAPQLIYIVISTAGLGIVIAKHGEPEEGTHNAFIHIVSCAITYSVLWWGGFFG